MLRPQKIGVRAPQAMEATEERTEKISPHYHIHAPTLELHRVLPSRVSLHSLTKQLSSANTEGQHDELAPPDPATTLRLHQKKRKYTHDSEKCRSSEGMTTTTVVLSPVLNKPDVIHTEKAWLSSNQLSASFTTDEYLRGNYSGVKQASSGGVIPIYRQ
ncbi:uncharacterized protein LOC143516566 [Brachyhypopomus gauderio]|uniref:uncharacterized protein LOC143516566 n=1 Tax=Brachyhypopomus gauderio TaxID=698409 RepID=UPI004041DD7D